jgi:hypothetical protein
MVDYPLCTLCQPPRRHALSEGHKFEGAGTGRIPPAPKKIAKVEQTVPAPGPPGADLPPGIVVGYDFKAAAACPECAMRRAKAAARAKKHRAGKKK